MNQLVHRREPASIDDQRVIRQNRDTLYSGAIVDISQGATLSIPDAGDRYLSVMVVNNDHYINDVLHAPGEYPLTVDRFGTDYVAIAARILVDPNDAADLDAVHTLQDQLSVRAQSNRPLVIPEYERASFDATRQALLTLAREVSPRSTKPSEAKKRSTRSVTCSVPRRAGAACPSKRRSTSASSHGSQLPSTRSRSATFLSTPSGRSRSTTPTASSNPTIATRTA